MYGVVAHSFCTAIQETSPRLSDVEHSVVLRSVFAIGSALAYLLFNNRLTNFLSAEMSTWYTWKTVHLCQKCQKWQPLRPYTSTCSPQALQSSYFSYPKSGVKKPVNKSFNWSGSSYSCHMHTSSLLCSICRCVGASPRRGWCSCSRTSSSMPDPISLRRWRPPGGQEIV